MITVMIFYVLGIAFFLWWNYREWKEWDYYVILFPLFQSILFAFAGAILAFSLPMKYEVVVWKQYVVALKDGSSANGRFFLGSGYLNGRMYFTYYAYNNDSTYSMWQAPSYEVKIKYVTSYPMVEITRTQERDCLWNYFAFDYDSMEGNTYVFEIPEGSIKSNYQLDAE